MVKLIKQGAYYMEGKIMKESQAFMTSDKKEEAMKNTLSYAVFQAHGTEKSEAQNWKFDLLVASGSALRTVARAASEIGLSHFPVPALFFGEAEELAVAKKFGADWASSLFATPAGYLIERYARPLQAVLTTEEAALGTLGAFSVTAESGELIRQAAGLGFEISRPETVAVFLKGKLRRGVGGVDVALSIHRATRASGFLKGKILEFIGSGLSSLSMDLRTEIDGLLFETERLSTLWETDEKTEDYLKNHGRGGDYRRLSVVQPAYYDWAITMDLSRVEPMIALSPEAIYSIGEYSALLKKGDTEKLPEAYRNGISALNYAEIIEASYETLLDVNEILREKGAGGAEISLDFTAATQAVLSGLAESGTLAELIKSGALYGDTCPAELSNAFGWDAVVMDPRSIAATVASGKLASACDGSYQKRFKKYKFDGGVYARKTYFGKGKGQKTALPQAFAAFPEFAPLAKSLFLKADGKMTERDQKGLSFALPAGCVQASAGLEGGWYEELAIAMRQDGMLATLSEGYDPKERAVLIRAGILPLEFQAKSRVKEGDLIFIEDTESLLDGKGSAILISKKKETPISLTVGTLTAEERESLECGSFVNREKRKGTEK